MSSPDRFRADLGAFALGALAPGEAQELKAHLRGCAACRRELTELQSVAPMVARAGPGTRSWPRPDSADRRRRRFRLVASGSVAGAAALAIAAVALLLHGSGSTVSFQPISRWVHASGTVAYEARPWGTQLVIRVSGLPAWLRCQIWVEAAGGGWQEAGSWRPTSGGTTSVEAASVLTVRGIKGVALETPQRQELLWAPAPDSSP